MAADYLPKLTESVTRNFENDNAESIEDDYVIPPTSFDVAKPVIIVEIPNQAKNELYAKQFMQRFYDFPESKFYLRIKWITMKTRTLFKLKDKCLNLDCKTYHGA